MSSSPTVTRPDGVTLPAPIPLLPSRVYSSTIHHLLDADLARLEPLSKPRQHAHVSQRLRNARRSGAKPPVLEAASRQPGTLLVPDLAMRTVTCAAATDAMACVHRVRPAPGLRLDPAVFLPASDFLGREDGAEGGISVALARNLCLFGTSVPVLHLPGVVREGE